MAMPLTEFQMSKGGALMSVKRFRFRSVDCADVVLEVKVSREEVLNAWDIDGPEEWEATARGKITDWNTGGCSDKDYALEG